jgi:hypothetical protein
MSFPVVTLIPANYTPLGVAATDRDARQRAHEEADRRRQRQGQPQRGTPAANAPAGADETDAPKIGTLLDVRA